MERRFIRRYISTIFKTGLIYSPGIAVFINDYAAVEASIGVLGIQMKQVNQKTNGVHTGSFKNSSANFKYRFIFDRFRIFHLFVGYEDLYFVWLILGYDRLHFGRYSITGDLWKCTEN